MTHPESASFDLPREDLLRAAAAVRAVATAIRTVRERRGRAAFSNPENAARKAAVAGRNALLPFDTATAREWNKADNDGRVRGAAHPDTAMTVRVAELSRGRYGVQAGWDGNHVETVVGDQHLARQLAQWLMADPTADRLDELRNALDPRHRRPAADRAAAAQAWGVRHDPLWLTHWRTSDDLVRAWRQATGRDPQFNTDLTAARTAAAAADPDWYRVWWSRHQDAVTPGARHLAELDIIRRYGPDADPTDSAAPTPEATAADSSTVQGGQAGTEEPPAQTDDPDFAQARQWVGAHDPTWYDLWSAHYDWAETPDGRRSLHDEVLARWRRGAATDPSDDAEAGPARTPMTDVQAGILTDAGRRPEPDLTWVEASLLIDEVRGTPRGEKAGQWLRDHGLSDDAADRAIAAAVAKLYPDQTPTSAPSPPTLDEIGEWFREHDPDYFQQWSTEHANHRDQSGHSRELERLWTRINGGDTRFNADLATARYQVANLDADAARRWREDREAAANPTARHELDQQLIRQWHPRHDFRRDNHFHTEPTPTLAQLLRNRVPDGVLDHPRWTTAEDTFAGLVDQGVPADVLADAVAAVDFDSGRVRAPSGYASWVMRETAKASLPEPGSDADRRRLVAEWLTAADPTNPINRSLAAQLVGEFDDRLDAEIARAFPGILDGDAHHPGPAPLDAPDRVFVADSAGDIQPAFHSADRVLAVGQDGRIDILSSEDRVFLADTGGWGAGPTRVAHRAEADTAATTTTPADPADPEDSDIDDDTLARAAAPLTPPATPTASPAATAAGDKGKPHTPRRAKNREAQPNQRRRTTEKPARGRNSQ